MTEHKHSQREPLIRLAKREGMESWKRWVIRLCSILLALVVCGVVTTAMTGENPIAIYKTM